jgi:hypothetical protein
MPSLSPGRGCAVKAVSRESGGAEGASLDGVAPVWPLDGKRVRRPWLGLVC